MEHGNVTLSTPQGDEEFQVYLRDWVVSLLRKLCFRGSWISLSMDLRHTSINYILDLFKIAITFFSILYIMSHFIIRAFAKIKVLTLIRMFLCTVCLAISLAAMLLLPITIVSNEIIYNYPNYYYTQWLHRELIFGNFFFLLPSILQCVFVHILGSALGSGAAVVKMDIKQTKSGPEKPITHFVRPHFVTLWNKIFWSANIALFIILPFSHFFYEAEGLGGQGQLARLYEALAVLVLVFFVSNLTIRGLLGEEEKVGYLPFSYSVISSVGALLVLMSTPRGFTTLTTFGLWLYLPVATRQIMEDKSTALDLEEQVINERVKERGYQTSSETDTLREVRAVRASFRNSTLHPIIRNIFSIVVTVVNLAFTGYLVLRVFIHLLRQFFSPLLFGDPTASELADFLALQDDAKAYRVRKEREHLTLDNYMMTSAFVGFYYLPITKHIQPKLRGMSMEKLTLNIMCVLLISSSFPVVARILEITSFDLIGDYSNTTYLRSNQFLMGYKFVFLVALTHRYVTFFNKSLHDILVNFMTPILIKLKTKFGHINNTGSLLDLHPKKD